jgi:hypothetical protein
MDIPVYMVHTKIELKAESSGTIYYVPVFQAMGAIKDKGLVMLLKESAQHLKSLSAKDIAHDEDVSGDAAEPTMPNEDQGMPGVDDDSVPF